ncbi:MAG: zf-TFIIB domain-containing protein [Reyranella sp.]|nr:zf-TFIIB domain-containing protein [Reyranella sp.]
MLCPQCKIDLVMADRQGVEIDYCPSCRGVWLDRGELDKIIERSAAYEARTPPAQGTAQPGSFLPQAGTPILPPQPAPLPQGNQGGHYDQRGYDRRDDCDDRGRRRRRGFLGDLFD